VSAGNGLPAWAREMRSVFRAGSSSQFVLYGNVNDLVPAPTAARATEEGADLGERRFVSLRQFLTDVMFEPFDIVIHYDRGRGIRVRKGGEHFHRFLKAFDTFRGTAWAGLPESGEDKVETLDLANLLPRDATRALELLDRFLRGSQQRSEATETGGRRRAPLKVGVVVDHAEFIAPQGEAISMTGERSQTLIQLLDWASDPTLTGAFVATVLISENLTDLNRLLVETPYSAKIRIPLPTAEEIHDYVSHLTAERADFEAVCEVSREVLAQKLVGLSRVNVRSLLLRALSGDDKVTSRYLTEVKKQLIEKEASGRVSFIEPRRTLDDVAGHGEAKAWLRQDAALLKKGQTRAIPMGYLLCGRIGTGKTYLVECWAGEVGVPVVEIKNFRERWVGATEGNLERIFGILHALGQVVVFVDEADQATGKRDSGTGDSGLSGRIYGMLAQEMSDTRNRGKIIWVFATSRPDLVEVDLKRQGRLDVHIPLFPPGDAASRHELFTAMARKTGIDLPAEELPELPDNVDIGGNEMEGILVRALRVHETQPDSAEPLTMAESIAEVIADVRPSPHGERLALMDMIAVKECTDSRFLPPRFRDLTSAEINKRIGGLRLLTGE
jgi:ATPase family associated with various cellular activities (AAA)